MSQFPIEKRKTPPTSKKRSFSGTENFAFIPPKARLVAAGALFLLLAGIIVGRLFILQVAAPDRYVAWGDAQRSRNFSVIAPRGDIIDRNGNAIAISLRVKTIWADPGLVREPEKAAHALMPILDMGYTELLTKLKQNNRFVYLKRKVSSQISEQVHQLGFAGIYSLTEYQRNNPSGDELGNSFRGTVGSEEQGLGGVEYYFNDILAGSNGAISFEGNVLGNSVDPTLVENIPAQQGSSLQISMDLGIQYGVELLLHRIIEETRAEGGIVLVSKPKTGEILAMATALGGENGAQIVDDNRAVTWAYEPGSAMKPFLFSAVLETGTGQPDSTREVPDTYRLYDSEFLDHTPHDPEELDISEIVTYSSNIGSIFWAQDLGRVHLNHYLRRFGFGSPTNIQLPGESAGIMLPAKEYSGTSIATIPLGQGISVTPIQLLFAYNTIANKGVYVPPRIILSTSINDEWVPHFPVSQPERVISEKTANEMNEILAQVVTDGTGQTAGSAKYSVAGKTGTARKPQSTGGYVDEDGNFHYIATFAGYFPIDDPEISIIVIIDEPQNSIYASETAAPAFADLVDHIGGYLGIVPSSQKASVNQIATGTQNGN